MLCHAVHTNLCFAQGMTPSSEPQQKGETTLHTVSQDCSLAWSTDPKCTILCWLASFPQNLQHSIFPLPCGACAAHSFSSRQGQAESPSEIRDC